MDQGPMSLTQTTPQLKVGELAKRTGLTIRTLHHYDEIGLLSPATRTASGHRLYGASDVERLQRIASLRQLGLGLTEIADCLDDSPTSFRDVLVRQIAHVRRRVESELRLAETLEGLVAQIDSGETASTDQLLATIHLTTLFERYYSPEQRQQMEARARDVGAERIAEAQEEWSRLHTEMDAARRAGLAADSPVVQTLATRASALVTEFTGGDSAIEESLGSMFSEQPSTLYRMWGISDELGAFYGDAMAALSRAPSSGDEP